MSTDEISSSSCAFIPVYCYYDNNGEEVKTPILIMDSSQLLLRAIIIDVDPNIFNSEELKDIFIDAYYNLSDFQERDNNSMDHYDIYPQFVSALHTDNEEISIYICELYENSEIYFKKQNNSKVTELISYKKGIDELIQGGALEELTEKILISLSEENHLSSRKPDNSKSIELF